MGGGRGGRGGSRDGSKGRRLSGAKLKIWRTDVGDLSEEEKRILLQLTEEGGHMKYGLEQAGTAVTIAAVDGEIVGWASCWIPDLVKQLDIYVASEFRGHKIGEKLLTKLVSSLPKSNKAPFKVADIAKGFYGPIIEKAGRSWQAENEDGRVTAVGGAEVKRGVFRL